MCKSIYAGFRKCDCKILRKIDNAFKKYRFKKAFILNCPQTHNFARSMLTYHTSDLKQRYGDKNCVLFGWDKIFKKYFYRHILLK